MLGQLSRFNRASLTAGSGVDTLGLRYFFGYTAPCQIPVWNGTAWVLGTVKRWDGAAWVDTIAYRWNGTAWVPVGVTSPTTATITGIAVNPSTWGDFRVSWACSDYWGSYLVELIDTANGSTVTSRTVTATEAFFDLESVIPNWGFVPGYFRIRITAGSTVATWENSVGAVDDSWVKKVIIFGGQSNCEGHMTFLSGSGGRLDLVSAADIRRAVATSLGLSYSEVMPLNLTFGDSAIDKKADVNYPSGTNYWYDLDGAADGPRLTSFLAGAAAYASRAVAIVWAQGETDAAGSYAGGSRVSTPARWKSATTAVFNRIRTVVSATQAPIVFQTLGRSWWNGNETDGVAWQNYRNAQRELLAGRSDVWLGSWAPGNERIGGYQADGIHYSSAVFHASAASLADAIVNSVVRLSAPPAWVDLPALTGVTATQNTTTGDVTITWDAGSYTKFAFANTSVADGSVLYSGTLTTNSYVFTAAAQTAAYGFTTNNVSFVVGGYVDALTAQGPGQSHFVSATPL